MHSTYIFLPHKTRAILKCDYMRSSKLSREVKKLLSTNSMNLLITGCVRGNKLKFLNTNFGDWFVLHQVYKNIQRTNFAQLVSKLCGQTTLPLRRNETHIFYDVNEPDNGNGEDTNRQLMETKKNGFSIQEQLQEQQKRKFDVGSNSTDSLNTIGPT